MSDKPVAGWLSHACGHPVEHHPCPHPNVPIAAGVAAAGVMHTIEGSLNNGLAVFDQHYAPHFAVGGGRIVQLVPLGYEASSLEHIGDPPTNQWARAQIELQGHSQEHPWNLAAADPTSFESLAHLLAALSFPEVAGIPLHRPFPDRMPPGPWATPAFVRRHAGFWGKQAGWYGHVEIPENEHWDPGALQYTPLLARAGQIAASTKTKPPAAAPELISEHGQGQNRSHR